MAKKYFAGQNFSQSCPGSRLSHLTSGIGSNFRTKNILLVEVFLNLSRVSWNSIPGLVSSNPHAIAFPKYFAGRILSHLLNDISDKRTT
jgi:hypothetical protein